MVDFGDPGVLVVIDPDRRLAERQARPRATTRSRSRSPTARRWPTSRSATSTTSARARSGARVRGGGAFLNDAPLDDPLARAPPPRRQARARRDRVGRPALARGVLRRARRRHRPRPRAWARSRSRCARSPRRASTGWRRCGTAARSTPPPRQLDRPRERRRRRLHRRCDDPLGAPLDLEPRSPVVAARTAGGARRARHPARIRPRGDDVLVIDWSLAERVAGAVAGSPNGETAKPLPGDLAAMARRRARARRRLRAASSPPTPLPPPEAVDRARLGARRTCARCAATLDPLVSQDRRAGNGPLAGPLRAAGGMLLAGEIGGIVGFMGRHVLGQYELALLDPTQGAAPAARRPEPPRGRARHGRRRSSELLPWVVFHEVTHAVQFNGVPWLREHLAGMLRELLVVGAGQRRPDARC